MPLNIVLIEPEIPNNTGNIGRLSLASGSNLHLVKPFGFSIDDTRLKRAGLDYWQHLNIKYYDSVEHFFSINKNVNMVFLSSHGNKLHWQIPFENDMFLVFGKESIGLPKWLIESHPEKVSVMFPPVADTVRKFRNIRTVCECCETSSVYSRQPAQPCE